MVRSRRFRKNKDKPEWGKDNPRNKERNRKALIVIGILAVAAVAISVFFVFFGGALFANPSSSPSVSPSPSATPLTSPAGEYSANGTRVLLVTSMGNITIQLRDDKPITTANFLNLTGLGLYDNTIFHRVMAGFMIQGGAIVNATIPNIADEIGTDNHNYNTTIAMANTGEADSASSQFFINVADNNNLYDSFDTSYTVFGRVIDGMDVVMAISQVPTDSTYNMPLQDVTLIKAEVLP
jgi:cyclophilin family peptidyl-prolyl cis-trans isomerase